jgi:succinate dehydrogenase flavin-adding protein (antitoxin of CptAB toxin-antitoxin module)
MKDTFDVHAWNKRRYLNENKGREEADKVIQQLRSSVIKKLNDEELEEFRKALAEAFDMSLNESSPLNQD